MADTTAFAEIAPIEIKIASAQMHPNIAKRPFLYPLVIDILAVVKKTGPTEIKTKKHK